MRVFIIAGEPSGDKLGGALMRGLKKLHPDIAFDGIGGPDMQAQGLKSRFDMSELSIMGLLEILPRYRALKRRIRETADRVIADEPDVLISIDSPEFCFRVAKRVKAKSNVPTVHYVAPTVWAWRPWRASRIAEYVDHLLVLFPFEPACFEPHGMSCDFVGHPVVAEPVASENEAMSFRAAHGIADAPVLLVLPGSRAAEVKRLKDVFGKAVKSFVDVHTDARVVVPAAVPVADMVLEAVESWPVRPVVLDPRAGGTARAQQEKRAA
ncbi:MAG: lipid-A-disaccharide synthase, partial [Roseobacter sp.]